MGVPFISISAPSIVSEGASQEPQDELAHHIPETHTSESGDAVEVAEALPQPPQEEFLEVQLESLGELQATVEAIAPPTDGQSNSGS